MDATTVLTFIKQVIATLMTLLMMMSPAFDKEGKAYEAKDADALVSSFAVVSDIHVETNHPESYTNFSNLLKGIKGGKDIDSVIYLGDNVMNGQLLENVFFYMGVRAMMPAENNLVIPGNHDMGNGAGDYDRSYKDFIANNNLYFGKNLKTTYYYEVINGCYMICLASEDKEAQTLEMNDEQLQWLEGVLKEAQAAGAPTFVFNHFPLRYLAERGNTELADLLKKYDVDLYFHGHIHNDLGTDNFYTWGGVDSINLPRATETTEYEPGDGLVVEVYENEVLVRGRDFIKGEWIEELVYTYPISK